MGDEMQDGDAGIAGADGDEHEAEVRRGGSRQELFGMILQQRHEAAGDRSRQADRDDSAGKGWGMAQQGMQPGKKVSSRRYHSGGVQSHRNRGGSGHSGDKPERERKQRTEE